jgi:hypothetical protein
LLLVVDHGSIGIDQIIIKLIADLIIATNFGAASRIHEKTIICPICSIAGVFRKKAFVSMIAGKCNG